jgi:phosphoglycolate phosphatase
MPRYILFDFDGTLADSRALFISVFNQLASKYGFKPVDPENMSRLKALSLLDRMKALGVPIYRLPFLTTSFLKIYANSIDTVPMVSGITEVLQKLQENGFELVILSSNAVATIRKFLENNNINTITAVHCSSQLFGKDRLIKKFLKKAGLHPGDVIYVGDEERDIDACTKVNVRMIWVSWGFDAEAIVINKKPSHIARTPGELADIVLSHYKSAP